MNDTIAMNNNLKNTFSQKKKKTIWRIRYKIDLLQILSDMNYVRAINKNYKDMNYINADKIVNV